MSHFDERVRDLVAHAYSHAPAVRQLMDAAGVSPSQVQTAADLSKIPVMSKDKLVEIHHANPPFGGFLTIDPAELPRIYVSPGPIYDPQPPLDDPTTQLAPFAYVGFGKGDRVLNTFMYHLTPAGLLIDEALRALGATVLPTGPGNTELQLMLIQSLQVTGFTGQPSYLMTLLDAAEKMGMNPDSFPIKKALFSAEPYFPAQRERFEGKYGMKTTSAFGTADLGFIGYTMEGVQGFCMMENAYIQIADPKTGEAIQDGGVGELVVTLFNKKYPLIRFGTGDLSALAPEPDPQCGGKQQLLGLYGRSGEAIKVRGMFLHPNQLKGATAQFPQITAVQAIITRPQNSDVVTLRVQLKEGADPTGLAEQLQDLAQRAVRLRIDDVEFVEKVDTNQRTIMDQRPTH